MTLKNPRKNGGEVNLKGRPTDGLEMHIQKVKGTPKELRVPGTEVNFKAKKRWEILRRTENYRQDWDAAFARMVEMLKFRVGVRPDGLGGEKDRGKRKKLKKKMDLKTWEAFREKQFQQEWPPAKLREEFIESTYHKYGRELADKYRLISPYHYDDALWEPYKDKMPFVFADILPVKIIAQNPTSYEIVPDRAFVPLFRPILYPFPEIPQVLRNHLSRLFSKKVIFDHTPHLRDGRFLTIEIDLYEKLGPIRKLINSHLNFYQKELKRPKVKKRDSALSFYIEDATKRKVSIYELWDMNKRYGKSPWKITKELYPSATHGKHFQPYKDNYDSGVRAIWMQIDTAIKTAEKEINPSL